MQNNYTNNSVNKSESDESKDPLNHSDKNVMP